jgi:hypothetical protein
MNQENMTSTTSSQPRNENPGMQDYDSREGERRMGDRRGEHTNKEQDESADMGLPGAHITGRKEGQSSDKSRDKTQNADSPSNPDIDINSSDPRIYVHEENEKNEGLANRNVSGGRSVPSEKEENPQVRNTKSESDPNIHG